MSMKKIRDLISKLMRRLYAKGDNKKHVESIIAVQHSESSAAKAKEEGTHVQFSVEKVKLMDGFYITGYFPPPSGGYKSEAEARMEGGALDCLGNKLRTLQDYHTGSYVSIAVDKKVIPLRSVVCIEGFDLGGMPIRFVACDVGGAIKGKHIDICVSSEKESFKVTRRDAKIAIVGTAKI